MRLTRAPAGLPSVEVWPSQRRAASVQASVAERSTSALNWTALAMAWPGLAMERAATTRRACAIPAQSIGITSCSGLAFQTLSIEASTGFSTKAFSRLLLADAEVGPRLKPPHVSDQLWNGAENICAHAPASASGLPRVGVAVVCCC